MGLKLQPGNAKRGLWEEEISFPRPAGIAEKNGQVSKHTLPSAGLRNASFAKVQACSHHFEFGELQIHQTISGKKGNSYLPSREREGRREVSEREEEGDK